MASLIKWRSLMTPLRPNPCILKTRVIPLTSRFRTSPSATTTSSFSTRKTLLDKTPRQIIPEKPRSFPTSNFEVINADQPVGEEQLSDYRAHRFYPVQLGEVFQDRYQAIAKLGFGSSSTTWLARDLRERNTSIPGLKPVHTQGKNNIRKLLDSFKISGPDGEHIVLVCQPAQMSLHDMKLIFSKDGFEEDLVKGAIVELLQALDFLHTQGEIVHTDVHYGNMLLGQENNELFRRLEDEEFSSPVPRKQASSDRSIYLSRLMRPKPGPMLLCDFGEARIGPGPHSGDIMPVQYRAPETLFHIAWSYPVDIWSVRLTAWELLEPTRLFTARDDDGDFSTAAHIAQMIAALGPPPRELLAKSPKAVAEFWDEKGNWRGRAPIPHERTMEALENRLEDNSGFLRFMRRALTWMPDERPSARELLKDPWLADGI